jgi:cation diffusion facilitator family transporter
MSAGADSLKSISYALTANLVIACAKGFAAWVTGSGAMLAEAIHSLADTSNQLLLILGLKKAKKPPSMNHPLGSGKEIYFWSFIVAIILFSLGGLFSLYEGWQKLAQPEPLSQPWIAVAVLVFSIVAEGASLLGCVREINKVRGSRSLWRWFRQTRQSELAVIFGEDLAALLGLTFALGAVVVTMATGNPIYDAIGTLGIGLLLIAVAFLIGREVKELLIGQGVEAPVKDQMTAFLESRRDVAELYNLLTLQLGNDVMVAVKARMAAADSAEDMIKAINVCEVDFKARFPQVLWLFFEPDIKA